MVTDADTEAIRAFNRKLQSRCAHRPDSGHHRRWRHAGMQALSRTLFPATPPPIARSPPKWRAFLEAGAGVRVLLAEGEIGPGEDLVGKAREARMADIVLVLFSRQSLPSPWPRL
jgi:hypothetical protein